MNAEALGGIISSLAAIIAVLERDKLTPGLVGLSITYAIQVWSLAIFWQISILKIEYIIYILINHLLTFRYINVNSDDKSLSVDYTPHLVNFKRLEFTFKTCYVSLCRLQYS